MSRKDILNKKDSILEWIKQKQPKSYICKQLNCKPSTLESYLTKMGITYKGNKGFIQIENRRKHIKLPLDLFLQNHGKEITSYRLKLRLINEGLKERKCEICNNTEWLDRQIPLELHHINGDHYDNRLENLQILCPNCHALQENNSGAASKKGNKMCL